jgi:hypothetical protein
MRWVRTFASLALAGLIGCGSSDEDSFTLVRVTGTITQNGKPLAGADVSFVPQAGNKNSTPGVDQSGPQGNYMPKFKGRTGLAPGKYKVTIIPPDEVSASKVPEKFQSDPMMFNIMKQAQGTAKKASDKKEVLKNEFDAEVPDKDVVLDFDVKASSAAGSAPAS